LIKFALQFSPDETRMNCLHNPDKADIPTSGFTRPGGICFPADKFRIIYG